MTTVQRQNVRGALLTAGFRRTTAEEPDEAAFYNNRGAYKEIWRHTKDRTKITLEWDHKTPE